MLYKVDTYVDIILAYLLTYMFEYNITAKHYEDASLKYINILRYKNASSPIHSADVFMFVN